MVATSRQSAPLTWWLIESVVILIAV